MKTDFLKFKDSIVNDFAVKTSPQPSPSVEGWGEVYLNLKNCNNHNKIVC